MKQKLLKTWLVMLCMLVGIGSAWAEADYTLTPTAGSNNSYTGNCDVTIDDITWNVTGNASMVPWRLGGKSISNVDRTVYSKTAYTSAVSKVDLTVGAASSITVNSLKLVYSTNADFSNSSEISKSFAANSTISFEADFPANAYYKFVFNVTVSVTSNKFVEFSKVEFYNKASGGSSTPTTYTVSIDNNIANGTVTANPTSATEGATVTLTATPSTGYEFGSWNVTDESSNTITVTDNKFTMPAANVNVSATFNKTQQPDEPITDKTIAEFISNEGGKCYLTGTVSNISNTTYGNFDLTDESGTIYIYGCLTPEGESKKFNTLDVVVGDKIKVLAETYELYNEKHEAKNVIFIEEIIVEKPQFTVTIETPENGTLVIKEGENTLASGDKVEEGKTLTIECTPTDAENYRYKNWQYKENGNWVTMTTTMTRIVTQDISIRANFELIPTYTVAWSVNGTIVKSEDLKEGAAVTAPEVVVPDYTDKVFTGWVETSTVVANETPAYVTPATTASEDVTYYAVFAEKVSDGNVTWTVVDNVNNLKDGDVVIIATQKGFTGTGGMKTAGEISNNLLSCTASTFSQDNTTITNVADGTVEFTLAKSSTEWQFVNGGKYLAMIGDKNVGLVDNTSTWSISINGYLATVSQNYTKSGATSASTYKLQYNYNNGNDRFTGYTSSQTSISLYKKAGSEAAYSDFTTTVSAPTPDHGTLTLVATNDDGYWATFSSDKDVIFDANDIIAYTVAVDDNKLVMIDANANSLSCVTDKTKDDGWVAGYYVQAGAAVLINSLENSVNYYYIDTDPYTANNLDEIEMDPEYNMLRPSNVEMTGNCLFYKLAYGDWENKKDLGFFWGADNGAAFDTWTGGAYLAVPTSVAAAKGFTFDGAATAISNVNADAKANSSAYNLAGQRVKANVKGLIIMNGKKYLNK